jgi:hypothetical protein
MKDLRDIGPDVVQKMKEIAADQSLPDSVRRDAVETLRPYAFPSEFPTPNQFNEAELDRAGVTIVDASAFLLRCKSCGTTWSSTPSTSGKLPLGFWRCPLGCNL